MPEPTIDDKIVVITGAGRGLGFGMARRFGQAGAHVIVAELEVALEVVLKVGRMSAWHSANPTPAI